MAKKETGTPKKKGAEGLSVEEIEKYTRKYTSEIFMIVAIAVAMFSSIFDFFIGASWGIFLTSVGFIYGLLCPKQVEAMIRKMLAFATKDKSTEIMVGIVRIVIAIFLPAILFGILGLVSGTAYQTFCKKK